MDIQVRPRHVEENWYDDRNNLADLWRWLKDQGDDPDPAYFLEKPWKWSPEFAQMMAADDTHCAICGRTIDREKGAYVATFSKRGVHVRCAEPRRCYQKRTSSHGA